MQKPALAFLWTLFLSFPLLGLKTTSDPEDFVHVDWIKPLAAAGMVSFLFVLSRFAKSVREFSSRLTVTCRNLVATPGVKKSASGLLMLTMLLLPLMVSSYQNTILTTTMMYVVLGLGLNIVVGLAGLLDLGYVAFYAVGAYTYGLLFHHLQLNFWLVLPVAGLLAGIFGILLGIPVLRLRGDYLAIVTLGFGEIIRIVLENWDEVTFGPQGIINIGKPPFFGTDFDYEQMAIYIYYVILFMVLLTCLVVSRLTDSRLGRAWKALREDELACSAMGINTTSVKLYAFGLGACWAGFTGAFFASKNSFVNPASFTFIQSALILCIVILGGSGSIPGIILASLILILTPEYFRFFEQYRMLIFGFVMVIMMILRPGGLISHSPKIYGSPPERP